LARLRRFFGLLPKKEAPSVIADLRNLPPPNSEAGIRLVEDLLKRQDIVAVENLYNQSIQDWRTDWQCALCEIQCKLNPGDNQKLILWLSAYIADKRKDHARKLHAFISQLPMSADEEAHWLDVNVQFNLMNDNITEATALVSKLHEAVPNYPIAWPKIAIMKYFLEHGDTKQVSKIAIELLEAKETSTGAIPSLLEALLSTQDLDFVTEYCLGYVEQEIDLNPEVVNIGARSMLQAGRADLSLRFLLDHADLIRKSPYAWFTLRECVLKLDRYADASAILEDVLEQSGADDVRFRRALLQIDLNDIDGAAKTLSEFTDASSEWAAQLRVLIASLQPEMRGAADAYGAFLDLPYSRTNVAMIYAGNLLGQARTQVELEKVNQVLEAVEETSGTFSGFMDLRIKSLIASGQREAAKAVREKAKSVLRPRALDSFDQYLNMCEGKDKEAGQVSHAATARARNRAVHNASALPVARTFSYDAERDQVLCFCCVFNGVEFVEWFLDYYRTLGVDHFFFVDNASTDGTTEHLAAQDDVSLFIAEGSFKDSAHGVYWINDLMKSYALGKWSFFVDMDEAFVYPMMDQGRSLGDLLNYFDEQGYECTPSLMLDMFSDQGDGGSFADNCYFDNSYLTFPSERAPYKTTQGGFRTRMTGRNMLITKSPLVKVKTSFSYIENNHFHTHLNPSDITTCVLHYKFVGAVSDRIEEALTRKEHFLGATFYKDLKRAIHTSDDNSNDVFCQGPDTLRYGSAQDLVEVGVIETSPAWQSYEGQSDFSDHLLKQKEINV
jgi:hypothetical protein